MTNSKYQQIFDDLLAGIRKGTYLANDQLPSERELAVQYGVARATARRALTDLTAMGIAVRRGRRGTIVTSRSSGNHVEILNLVCTAEPLATAADFLRQGVQAAHTKGWGVKITRIAPDDELTAWQALALGTKHLILAEGFDMGEGDKIFQAISRAADRSVVLATRVDASGIASVLGDDRRGMGMAVDHLRRLGHRKIALVTGGETLDHPVLSVLHQEWKKRLDLCMTSQDFRDCVLRVAHLPFHDLALTTRDAMSAFLRTPAARGVTAYIGLYEEIAIGAVAACRDAGLSVPKDVSVMGYGVTERGTLRNPPLSGISVQMDKHVCVAVDLLEKASKRGKVDKLLNEIPLLLIEGGTAGPAPAR